MAWNVLVLGRDPLELSGYIRLAFASRVESELINYLSAPEDARSLMEAVGRFNPIAILLPPGTDSESPLARNLLAHKFGRVTPLVYMGHLPGHGPSLIRITPEGAREPAPDDLRRQEADNA